MNSKIIVIGGLPGTGKTTIATKLAKEIGIALYSKDTLEAVIVRSGVAGADDLKGVGYEILNTLALNEFKLGRGSILDSIASIQRVNSYWKEVLSTQPIYIECTCSDEALHRERLESRSRAIDGWYELSWNNVLEIKKQYQPFQESRLILDSISTFDENVNEALRYVRGLSL